ncbi:zinc ribbon domain-containing protein [Oceanobacillus luteolus]|uniref:zinc ribbon domain-containing protein n=1 Tax=Oceanobacillus luteolus TaxID=1274358 RepID=UPI00203FE912|nr:zinc ribbon domain-containing protein [Oceanobacillus luteolus]MCM3739866.1 zinc ribbon domain-containing protein [Oceanobacillus luteolus]
MYYCPNCGTKVNQDEHYCIKCGKALPDIESRLHTKQFNKWWILPIVTVAVVIIVIGVFYLYLNNQSAKAMELYNEAENLLLEEEYKKAGELLQESLQHRKDFTQAQIALRFSKDALRIEEQLDKAKQTLENEDYNHSLELIHEAENNLNTYHGSIVSTLVEKIDEFQALVRLQELQAKLSQTPSIDEIRILIWEAEEIKHPDANEIALQLREQLVDYTFSKASEALNDKQFNDALLITEDGLKYAPDSEKLQSLLTNINKEKLSFESAINERLEQAMDTAYKENQINKNDAIELVSVDVENDKDGKIVIKGEVKSNATVPINSILVEYSLSRNEEEFLSNEIYVFPDVLYPTEHGRFEFTHFDLEDKSSDISAEVKKITWYTE